MSTPPQAHLAPEQLSDYFAGDLGAEDEGRIEDHVFECASCASRFDAAATLAANLRSLIPPVITHEKLDRLRDTGWAIKRLAIDAGAHVGAVFEPDRGLLIFALQGEIR